MKIDLPEETSNTTLQWFIIHILISKVNSKPENSFPEILHFPI